MSTKIAWGTLILGAIAAFGVTYQATNGNILAAAGAAVAWIGAHLLPSPVASTTPPKS